MLAIAAELVIIGLQVLPFSPAALKPASWVIVVVWIVLGLALRLMSLRSRREWRIAVAARKPQVIAVVGFASGYEPADDGKALAAIPHIDEPDDGEHDRADEIDDEILHRVDQADVKIAAKAEVAPIDRHLRDVVDMNGVIGVGRIEHH